MLNMTWADVGAWFLGVPLRILIIVVVTAIAVTLLRRLINRGVRHFAESPGRRSGGPADRGDGATDDSTEAASDDDSKVGSDDDSDDGLEDGSSAAEPVDALQRERRVQRASAIGSLLGSVVTVVAVGIALLTILPLLGIDIAPLLTSAGVLGVALGFGAQNLVKDYLSGIFIVLEDQFGVGDTVELGGVVGTVEEVTLRVTRLRDLTGVVWYVRNGEILTVGNRSQGWTLAIADIPVAPDTDLAAVRQIVREVGDAMMADSDLRGSLLAAPSFGGVESVSGEATVVRVVARAAAEDQVMVSRALRERLKDAFDAAGIRIPMMMRLPGAGGGPATPGPSAR
jgi:small conductance mechanosensitive channel